MIRISDNALVLSTRKHAENSALLSVLTEKNGVYHGIARSVHSKKNRGLYQPGNLIAMEWSARLEEHIGSIKAELIRPGAALVMDDARATAALTSASALLALCLPERHAYPRLFHGFNALLHSLAEPDANWLNDYVQFELLLLSETGFGLDLTQCAATGQTHDLIYVSPKSGRAVSREAGEPYKDKLLALNPSLRPGIGHNNPPLDANEALALTGYFLEHRLFEAVDKKMPAARQYLMQWSCHK